MKAIEIKDLCRNFALDNRTLPILKNISFSVDKGEMVAITGASGSGKTTLMRIIGCLDQPTSGTYLIDGEDVSHMNADQRAHIRNRKIGFVFQQFNLLPDLSAAENVALPKIYAGASEAEAMHDANTLLNSVGLAEWGDHFPYQLSGGQQQRVAISRSLINKPAIILADEPTGNLDSETGKAIMALFHQLNKSQKTTIVMVTHDPEIAKANDRILRIHDGKIVQKDA